MSHNENQSERDFHILPYSAIVRQEEIKLALELAYIAPRVGGVLISGKRGTAKSTAVRAFSYMVHGCLPTTLPINATEDRVVGGWRLDALMKGEASRQPGLLEEAKDRMLYVDEVNLLEDHIVNIILDVASTGVLVVEREAGKELKEVRFVLVGTMNPEEGMLRPQLLDRFGLMVTAEPRQGVAERKEILKAVLDFDGDSEFKRTMLAKDAERKAILDKARDRVKHIKPSDEVLARCAALADRFGAEGHRGEKVLALAVCAQAALRAAEESGSEEPNAADVNSLAKFALQHRRSATWDTQEATTILAQTTAELCKSP